MTHLQNRIATLLAALFLALAFVACAPTSYKTQRNLIVQVADSHEANLAAAERILDELDVADIRKQIRAAFPDVTEEHLETFAIKTNVLTVDGNSSAMIETSLAFTDTALPANEIMDFVQGMLEEKVQQIK
jgi:hypothetical protein